MNELQVKIGQVVRQCECCGGWFVTSVGFRGLCAPCVLGGPWEMKVHQEEMKRALAMRPKRRPRGGDPEAEEKLRQGVRMSVKVRVEKEKRLVEEELKRAGEATGTVPLSPITAAEEEEERRRREDD